MGLPNTFKCVREIISSHQHGRLKRKRVQLERPGEESVSGREE